MTFPKTGLAVTDLIVARVTDSNAVLEVAEGRITGNIGADQVADRRSCLIR